MKKNIKFESYNKQIEAVPYTKGMEDGHVIRYAIEEEYEAWERGKRDSFGTYGLLESKYPIEVPYIVSNNVQILLGEKYWLVKENNNLYGLSDKDFKSWIKNKEIK